MFLCWWEEKNLQGCCWAGKMNHRKGIVEHRFIGENCAPTSWGSSGRGDQFAFRMADISEMAASAVSFRAMVFAWRTSILKKSWLRLA